MKMRYYNPCPYMSQLPCYFCNYREQSIENSASPVKDTQGHNIQSSLFPDSIMLENGVIHPSLFNIEYPFTSNAENSEVKTKINGHLINKIASLLKRSVFVPEKINFEEIAEFYKVPLNDKGLLSVLFSIYTYAGGAHGITIYDSITLDLHSGRMYEFNELFNSEDNYTSILNEFIAREIKEKQIPIINEFKGINYNQQFYMTPNELVIYYQIYEYTPYAHGLFEITIPYADIKSILGSLSPIQKLI